MFGELHRTALAIAIALAAAAVGWTAAANAQASPTGLAAAPGTGEGFRALSLTNLPLANLPDSVMPTAGWARPPLGHIGFCRSFPAECERRGEAGAVALTQNLWTELVAVNRVVNKKIAPVTDLELHKTEELWTLPTAFGDCEDYVLLKRQALIRQGWPSGALLVAVVFDEAGEGHAVLIARTDRGDFVLDNKADAIRIWSQTPYRYVKRQSVTNPDLWVAVNDTRWPVGTTTSAN